MQDSIIFFNSKIIIKVNIGPFKIWFLSKVREQEDLYCANVMNLEYIEMNEINNSKKADKILQSVCASFKRIPIRNPEVLNRNNHRLTFNVNLEIQEEENSKFIPVPFDKNSFKLRRNFNKKVAVSVTQSTGLVLPVERLGT